MVQLHARKSRIRHSRRYQPSGAASFDICVFIESVRANGAAHSTLRWQLMFIKSCADMQHQFQQAQAHKRVTHACITDRVRNQTILMRHACDFSKTSRWNRIRRHVLLAPACMYVCRSMMSLPNCSRGHCWTELPDHRGRVGSSIAYRKKTM